MTYTCAVRLLLSGILFHMRQYVFCQVDQKSVDMCMEMCY